MVDGTGPHEHPSALRDAVIGWFPFAVWLVLIPLALYVPNQAEYDFSLKPVLPFMAAGLLSFLGLLGIFSAMRCPFRARIAVFLFWLGLFFALSDILAPVPLGLLEDFSAIDRLEAPLRLTLVQGALGLGILVCALFVPHRIVAALGPVLVVTLVGSDLVVKAADLSPQTRVGSFSVERLRGSSTQQRSGAPSLPNVYQLVFDGYSSCTFTRLLEARDDLRQRLPGFTFFPRNRSNYLYTPLSFASFMTGTLFEGPSLQQWEEKAVTEGLVGTLARAGYTVWSYPPGHRFAHRFSSVVKPENRDAWINTNFVRLWVVRVAPNPLREIANDGARGLGRFLRGGSEGSSSAVDAGEALAGPQDRERCCPFLEELLADEAQRSSSGNYVYFHINLPHPPLLWDCECRLTAHADYTSNACCALDRMVAFLDALRAMGKLDRSLVIIQSDHGWQLGDEQCPMPDDQRNLDAVASAIKTATNGLLTTKDYLDRTRALLLIKPPNAANARLAVSEAPSQLLDLHATVCDLLGLPAPEGKGTSVFRLDPREPREIHFFAGYKKAGPTSGVLVLGKHFRATEFAHFSLVDGHGWKRYPDFPVRYGGSWLDR
jgi:hypothetical protein